MGENKKYLLKNLDFEIPISFWVMYLDNFFGKEKAEEFYEYLINARDIKRKNDIRNLINSTGFSIYSFSNNEQLAFISLFYPFDTESKLALNTNIFDYYKNKNLNFLKDIKKLGYSFEFSKFNWKDKTSKNTYQREYIFIIYSEEASYEQFKNDIIELSKKYNVNQVLITEKMSDKSTKMKLKSNIFDVSTGECKISFDDTTIDTVEKYLSDLSNITVLFKIPYEKNKTVLNKDVNYLNGKSFYSLQKQEKVKNAKAYSCSSAMIKSALINKFKN